MCPFNCDLPFKPCFLVLELAFNRLFFFSKPEPHHFFILSAPHVVLLVKFLIRLP